MKIRLLALLCVLSSAAAADLQLAWNDNSSNETGFAIERAPGGTTAFVEIARVAAQVVTYRDTGLPENTPFSYRVRAFNAGGMSNYSNVATATTAIAPPGAPSNVTVTPVIIPPPDQPAAGAKPAK